MSATVVRHPVFARFFDRFSGSLEREVGPYREQMLDGVAGRVVEIGAGNGMNFAHYPVGVEQVMAVEPEPYLRARAIEAAGRAPVPVTVSDATANPLPFEDDAFDVAIACLVLCTVPDPAAALAELARVLKPGGELRFLEHVRAPAGRKPQLQAWLDSSGIWPWLGGGCHCARDTVGTIAAAGFGIVRAQALAVGPSWVHTNPHMLGVARAAVA